MRRLEAMAKLIDLQILQPVPFFPLLRPLDAVSRDPSHAVSGLSVNHAPMFYLPGLLKQLDGRFLDAAVARWIRSNGGRAPDVIDAHFGYPDGVGAARMAARLGRPVFITIRGNETDYVRHPGIGPQLLDALKSATGCISVSHALKDLMVRLGVPDSQFAVIPNAVDRNLFRPLDRATCRQRLGLESGRRVILSVGTLIALKRHHVVVQAMAAVKARYPDALLAIIGAPRDEPDYQPNLQRQIREAGLADSVRLVGAVRPESIADWLGAADVFCLVSEREGCCNSILEALACGRPVVCTPAGDNSHFVGNDSNGYIVPVDDAEATADALLKALSRDWDAGVISQELNVGSWPQVAAQVVEYFADRVAARGGMSPASSTSL
jgi:glycosyltransferase involved in cell wall biosynthesis